MAKVSLARHMKEQRPDEGDEQEQAGPFVTISRQFGCYGFSLGRSPRFTLVLRETKSARPLAGRIAAATEAKLGTG